MQAKSPKDNAAGMKKPGRMNWMQHSKPASKHTFKHKDRVKVASKFNYEFSPGNYFVFADGHIEREQKSASKKTRRILRRTLKREFQTSQISTESGTR